MKEVLQKGFDNMQAQLIVMKDELVKTQKELRKSQREAKKYRELYEVLRDEKFVTKSQKSKQGKTKGRDDDKDDWDGTSTPASESTPVEAENQNWLVRGAKHLKHIVPVLKEIALEKDSIVHCDETWCRVKIMDKYKKAYI